jgi:acyl carrier protein
MYSRLRDRTRETVGLLEALEPRIRELTMTTLGVDPADLDPEVSLTDELAADSLDLVELALALENEFRIVVTEAAIEEVRTYRDLVRVVGESVLAAHDGLRSLPATPPLVRTRVAARGATRITERATELTPYTAEVIAEDALRAGPGAELDIVVRSDRDDIGAVAGVEHAFAWLRQRGIALHVTADPIFAG